MKSWRCAAATTVALGFLAAICGLAFVYSGWFDIAATTQHGVLTNWVLHTTALHAIDRQTSGIVTPDLTSEAMIGRGLALFRGDCVQCHGAPGQPPEPFAMGLMPGAPRLMQVGRDWPARNVYWVIAHGIKMTAMPAWSYRLSDHDIWALAAFVQTLPTLSPAAYKAMADKADQAGGEAPSPQSPSPAAATAGPGDPAIGKVALQQYACSSCHVIPGIVAPKALIGPPLDAMGSRQYIAGLLVNTAPNMALWIRQPRKVKPGTAMPDMGVSERHARDIAAYLEALR